MNEFKEFDIDQSNGGLYEQAVKSMPGHPDKPRLKEIRNRAESMHASGDREAARKLLGEITLTYGSKNIGEAIKSRLEEK